MKRMCANCGRSVVFFQKHSNRSHHVRQALSDDDHNLCMKCWRAERNRNRQEQLQNLLEKET